LQVSNDQPPVRSADGGRAPVVHTFDSHLWFTPRRFLALHVEYAGGRIAYSISSIFSLFHEYTYLKYVRIHVIYRVNQAEYGIRIRVVAPH